MPNDKSPNTQPEADNEPFVLGQQLANAHRAEAKWRESGVEDKSPLPETKYDFWAGDLSLISTAPNRLDDEIRTLCRRYAFLEPDKRSRFRHSISMEQFYTLIDFAKRSALFGLRNSNRDLVVDGLTAIAMVKQERVDFRDILWCLGLLYHVSHKVGGDPDEMFRGAAALAEPEVARFFINFTEQPPEYRSLRDSWGYDEVETDNGVGFIGWGFNDFEPSIDLKSLAIEVSKLLDSDSYKTSRIEVATELPEVWLGSQLNADSIRVISDIRAGATVSASLHPNKHREHKSQQFTVFLVETASPSDAQKLCRMAEANSSTNHCKLALARSHLFCLVVARSFVVGINAYETNESLKRFTDGLSAILEQYGGVEEVN